MRTAPALLIASIAMLALAGCVKDEGPVIPDPLPTSTPIFASDEEALAAAEEALASYLSTVDAILADGGRDSDRLSAVATDAVAAQDEEGFAETREAGNHSIGSTQYDTLSLQQYSESPAAGEPLVTVYVCEDFSSKDVLDANNQSVVSPDRRTRWPLVVGFDSVDQSRSLIVSSVEDWSGDDFCAQ